MEHANFEPLLWSRMGVFHPPDKSGSPFIRRAERTQLPFWQSNRRVGVPLALPVLREFGAGAERLGFIDVQLPGEPKD